MIWSRFCELARGGCAPELLHEAATPHKGGSSSSNSTTTETTTQNTDKRQVVDNQSVGVSSDSSTVNVNASTTDYGAIEGARDVAVAAIDLTATGTEQVAKTISEVLGLAKDTLKLSGEGVAATQGALQTAKDSTDGNRVLVVAGMIAVGIVAAKSFGSK